MRRPASRGAAIGSLHSSVYAVLAGGTAEVAAGAMFASVSIRLASGRGIDHNSVADWQTVARNAR